MLTILFFGITKDITQNAQIEVPLAGLALLNDLKVFLYEKYPALANLKSLEWAHNEEYVHDFKISLKAGDCIALIPPVSGG